MPLDAGKVREAIRRIHDLPCALPVVRKAIEVSRDPNCTNGRMEQILSADQGVTARLLRLANSAYFGVSSQVSTLGMAVGVVGYERLQTLLRQIMVAEVFDLLSAKNPTAKPIWRVAVAAGAGCRKTAEMCSLGNPDELLAAGLLHNVGQLALLSAFGDQFQAQWVLGDAAVSTEAERAKFGVGSEEVGKWLLDGWNFPPLFGATCAYWKEPLSQLVEETLRIRLALVHVGSTIGRAWVSAESESQEAASPVVSPTILARLRLNPEQIVEICEGLANEVTQIQEFLDGVVLDRA